MKGRLHSVFVLMALLVGGNRAFSQTKFFRISGPASTAITSFGPGGNIIWSNAQPGQTYTVQTFSSLLGGTNWVDYIQLPTTNALNTNQVVDFNPPSGMVFIPAGSYTIGNTVGDTDHYITDAIPANVTVSSFYMDANLVTWSLWQSVYNFATNSGYNFANLGNAAATNHPVQAVDWYDSVKWCNARSQQAGLTPVFYTDAALTQIYTNGETDVVFANWSANGYRLPTEAEWEKAARGGLNGMRFPWGNTISWSEANYYASPGVTPYDHAATNGFDPAFGIEYVNGVFQGKIDTSPVGYFAPNGYGLFDMAGNVSEWCWDWYQTPPYTTGSAYLGGTDPRGSAFGTGHPGDSWSSFRVIRGGDWEEPTSATRCASRFTSTNPFGACNCTGFRCVRGH